MTVDPTYSAIQGIAHDLRDFRGELTGRLEAMVTRKEHEAEVRRIDSEHRTLAIQHADLLASADRDHADLRGAMAADRKAAEDERKRLDAERRADRRTYLQVTVAAVLGAVTVAVSVTSLIAQF